MGAKPWTQRRAHGGSRHSRLERRTRPGPNCDTRGLPLTHLSSSFLHPDSHRGPQWHFTPKWDVFSRETPLGQKLLDPRGRSPGRWICRGSIETMLWKNCFVACKPKVMPRRPDAGNQESGGERMAERQAQGRGEESSWPVWPRHCGRERGGRQPCPPNRVKATQRASGMGPRGQDSEGDGTPDPNVSVLQAPKRLASRASQGRVFR